MSAAEIRAVLLGDDAEARGRLLQAIEDGTQRVQGEVCPLLVDLLDHPDKTTRRRAAGALGTATIDGACRERAIAATTDPRARVRWGAAFALARSNLVDDAVLVAALEALAVDDGDVRWSAAEIVCSAVRTNPRWREQVERAAQSSDAVQRKMSLYCLRDLGVVDAAPYLAALEDQDAGVRLAALSGLARVDLTDPSMFERILACVRGDDEPGVRRAAVAALGRVAGGDAGVRAALEAIRSDCRDESLERAVALVLGENES